MNLEDLPYKSIAGSSTEHSITVYALSTCGFCKRAMSFLEDHGFAYRYLYVDTIPLETKTEIKAVLKEKFKENVAFPFAVIDGSSHLVGFIQPDWVRTLGLKE
jgi:glutaredoxin